MTRAQVRDAQRTLNRFCKAYLLGVTPLRVDGVKGHATNSRIQAVKYYLGYGKRDSSYKSLFVRRMRHPHNRGYFPANGEMYRTGWKRRTRQRTLWRRNHSHPTSGVGSYDGVRCALWLIPYLQWARAHGWRGRLVSGWRDPVYSESLCYRMCGRPSCPGRCAGRASNHSGSVKPHGACDVSDYSRFGSLMRSCPYSPRIFNALGAQDPVHYSASGR